MLYNQASRMRKSFKETLNEAVRLGLSRASNPAVDVDFVIEAREMSLRSGIDGGRFNSLLDEIDQDAFLESHAGGGK